MLEKFNELIGVRESYEAPAKLLDILYDKPAREQLFRDSLAEFGPDVGFDWFHEYFQAEHADRKKTKQDFTPDGVAHLVSAMAGAGTTQYEPAAGTGGMTIKAWDTDRRKHSPFEYRPSWYFYSCEELSNRAIPFLLFNLALRGMNALVVHCDVLTRKAYGAFFVQNDADDHLRFSNINRLPYNDDVARGLAVTWADELYGPLVESREDWWNLPAIAEPSAPRAEDADMTQAIYDLLAVVGRE